MLATMDLSEAPGLVLFGVVREGIGISAAQVPSSKVTARVPRSPAKKSRMVVAFVSRMDSMTTLPLESTTATEIVA